MARLPRILFKGQVALLTSSIEEGLPMPPNPLINTIIESCLARAQMHHRVKVCHFVFEANHVHMIVVVENPNDVVGFMERFKTESAHAINRLLGRKKKTVWCERYDCVMLATARDVIRKILYTYLNPAKDGLIDSIKQYPGLSSWKAFRTQKYKKACAWIPRSHICKLPSTNLTIRQYGALARKYKRNSPETHIFEVFPNAWMEVFGITDKKQQQEINNRICVAIEKREKRYKQAREAEGKTAIGAHKLMLRPMDTPYQPNRKGRKMWCICSNLRYRKALIAFFKSLVRRAREVYQRWKIGDYSVPYPEGMFPPPMPKVAEMLPVTVA